MQSMGTTKSEAALRVATSSNDACVGWNDERNCIIFEHVRIGSRNV